jgi:predicted dinucleotide-binding enzyme/predicted ester cyclase
MRIGVIGAGRIGGNLARLLVTAGHDVKLSFARDTANLAQLARTLGDKASVGTPRDACSFGDIVIFSVPWIAIDEAMRQAGPLAGKLVIDTTNPFTADGLANLGDLTSAQYNQRRFGADVRLVKSFNTLTAGFQAAGGGRKGTDRVVMFYVADDGQAGDAAARLIEDTGFTAVYLGTLADSTPMEAPRRPGAVYGEEYHQDEARAFAAGWLRQRRDPIGETFVQRYVKAFASCDYATLDELYDDEVVFYTPLAWGARGRQFLRNFIREFHTGYPGMTVTLHDEFYSADGTRACFRFMLHWRNSGTFFGKAPTGERGTMTETHSIRIRNGRIVEQWVGDNSFQMPYQELVEWRMDFPRDTPDPLSPILSVTAPQPTLG